jgi:ethanolamine ammonia-lyase large subunit
MGYKSTINHYVYTFENLKVLLAKASSYRSGDVLAGVAASGEEERVAAQIALANVPLKDFLEDLVIPYEADEVSRLIIDQHYKDAFAPVSHFTVGDLRNWMLSEQADGETLRQLSTGLTPEMVAAVSKLMRNQDLIAVSKKCEVVTKFRNTLGLRGHLSTRLQPNHPTDDVKGITASIIDGLLHGSGDAVIGINPASDHTSTIEKLIHLLNRIIEQFNIPTQACVLCHVSTTLDLIQRDAPVDLTFQSIGGTEKVNKSFGVNLSLLKEAHDATLRLKRGQQVMYFETGQGSALSAHAHSDVDQQTCEARAYAVARHFDPLLVNSVVGFIGPEYLFDGKQIIRAGLEDHFCGKLLGLPMGMDICYTNHANADQDDMDNLLTLLGVAGCNYIMGVPGADDIMLNYQSTSFHDALYMRKVLGLRAAPEFEKWLIRQGITDDNGNTLAVSPHHQLLQISA